MQSMRPINEQNERMKYKYFKHLRLAKGLAETSVEKIADAILRLEKSINFKSFRNLTIADAEQFRASLAQVAATKTGKPISVVSRVNTQVQVRAFMHWLADQSGYKSVIRHSFADHFGPTLKDKAIAHSDRLIPSATGAQAAHAFRQMPVKTVIDRRNRAVFALMMLTGARIKATCSLKIGHVNLADGCVFQDAADVATKFSKTFTTWFMPVEQEYFDCLADWIGELRKDLLFGPRDPLFPKPNIRISAAEGFKFDGLSRSQYSSEDTLRKVVKEAFTSAGLPSFTPHRFRNTMVEISNQFVTTAEELKAVSMNLGHSRISTTVDDYGRISPQRQGEVMRRLREKVLKEKSGD